MNNRRKLLIALGAGALIAPFASLAQQQSKVWRVGFLSQRHFPEPPRSDVNVRAFVRGMRDLGYVEGKNFTIELRSAEDKIERLPRLAAELVQLKVDVIVTAGTPAVRAVQKSTSTIPIVMGNAGDPVGLGFVKSLARPGGNITGLTNIATDISPKYLEMLLGMAPKLSRVAVMVNPDNPSHTAVLKNLQIAAQQAGVKIMQVEARTPREIETAFSVITQEKVGAVIVPGDSLFNAHVREIAELAAKSRLPSISAYWAYAEGGGLMNYGHNIADQFQRAATFVDKIFKGAKPGDLPVEQPMKLQLIINRKTAKALGLKIPNSLLVLADKVIE